MKRIVSLLPLLAVCALAQAPAEQSRWKSRAAAVTIIRDNWGIAHVYGKSDADTVFGALYAQAEDDFNRIETNFLTSLGRVAEAEGEEKIWQDLRTRMFLNEDELHQHFAASPAWLKTLMEAWADGLNYFLSRHPEVKPRVLRHFEPWMALSFTEGSIGSEIDRVAVLGPLREFYGGGKRGVEAAAAWQLWEPEPTGSNGIAIAPANTANKKALLLINPHTTFFFRSELQMVSEEGLNAYGASTWGQFFIYQGFNDRAGWMHTSSNVDNADEYIETVSQRDGHWFYQLGSDTRPFQERKVTVAYRKADGSLARREFTVYRNHRGPVIRKQGDRWVTAHVMIKPVAALSQSYLRTKARSYAEYLKSMEWKANSSNNTIYADADGNIAYFHGNFIPRRDTRFDFTKPLDGTNPATDWQGEHTVEETPHQLNPATGWLYNTNNWPWSGAGAASLKQSDYPAYVEQGRENPRGIHAIRLLENRRDFTLDSLLAAAYDSYMPFFEDPVRDLVAAWDSQPAGDPLKTKLREPIALMRAWDLRWSLDSVPTTLGMFYRIALKPARGGAYVKKPAAELLQAFDDACRKVEADFGTWKTPWQQVNRFQRLTGAIQQKFDDSGPSIPVAFTTGTVGSLASFAAQPWPGTKKWYGTSGNSFVAAVEFGKDRIEARAVSAGGESGDPKSKHFTDQAQRYATGSLRKVYFYRDDLKGHVEREYHP